MTPSEFESAESARPTGHARQPGVSSWQELGGAVDARRMVLDMATALSRYTDSQLRQLVDAIQLVESADPDAVITRLRRLQRGLEPEDEFALILTWLGRCQLVHKLSQEQLPLSSTDTFRVPDLFAIFDYEGRSVPVLIEVKKTEPKDPRTLAEGHLSLKPALQRYADVAGLPLLVAWKHRSFWTLFEQRHATLRTRNQKIGFFRAMEENLLSVLGGDFSYKLAPGTALRLRIKKLESPDPVTGRFRGVTQDAHFVNPAGERIPNIPHLLSLFMFWENDAELVDEGEDVVQSFVAPDVGHAELASRTLTKIVHAFAQIGKETVNWRAIAHDPEHVAHDIGRLRSLANEGAQHGVITDVVTFRPHDMPAFL